MGIFICLQQDISLKLGYLVIMNQKNYSSVYVKTLKFTFLYRKLKFKYVHGEKLGTGTDDKSLTFEIL